MKSITEWLPLKKNLNNYFTKSTRNEIKFHSQMLLQKMILLNT
jgi:hypothetical protein